MAVTKHGLFVEQRYGNLDRARRILREQYGLVAPNEDVEVRKWFFFKKKGICLANLYSPVS